MNKHRDEIAAGEEDYSEESYQPIDPQESSVEEEIAFKSAMLKRRKRKDEINKK